jgi:hypothetical protein
MIAALLAAGLVAYPVDDAERTGIRRLTWQAEIDAGRVRGTKLVPGAQWPAAAVDLRLTEGPGHRFRLTAETPHHPQLQAGLQKILSRFPGYGVALLDLTRPDAIAYAAVREDREQTPGSVAKLLVAAGFLDRLAERLPRVSDREAFLRSALYTADGWAMPNHHEVPVIDDEGRARIRAVRSGDRFTAWEWLDHALSPSSNAAASMVWREAAFLAAGATTAPDLAEWTGQPVAAGARDDWARAQGRDRFSEVAFDVVDRPLRRVGIDPTTFRLRRFFTRGAGRYIRTQPSRATPRAVLQWALAMEQGRIVDRWSSRELKRLLYLTRRRIRYAYAKELRDAAVYFKSGSLYGCKPEEGFRCRKYRGNRINVLNSCAIVETRGPSPADRPAQHYAVVVMSNVLRRNASYDHAVLAGEIHRLILERHR